MKKIVIIGANDFQKPLILKAKEMGYETHVFAWREGATGAEDADYFYEISIVEKDQILKICQEEIHPDAVATIGSDLANITVQYLAEKLGLPGNSSSCLYHSTNKYAMRKAFQDAGIPVPCFQLVSGEEEIYPSHFPVIVKPTDRSGSRAITKVTEQSQLKEAIRQAVEQSFEKKAIVEEYLTGEEYSVETISYEGKHTCLAITKKFTTGSPHYIETGHLQPAPLSESMRKKVENTVFSALDALEVKYGAGHSELRIDGEKLRIIEIGSRMGGDCIGSDLVPLSTGQDFVGMVVDTALGKAPSFVDNIGKVSAIRFLMNENDQKLLEYIRENHPSNLKKTVIEGDIKTAHIVDSGSRPGFFILQADTQEEMQTLLHHGPWENPLEEYTTPLQKLRFTEGENQFFMKREDLLPFAFGGNKVRFAGEFIRDMQRENCDSMIIYGNYHSNLCRILATLCHELELPCYMVHNQDDVKEERESANSRIIRQMGVTEIPCGKSGIAQAVEQAMAELREKGFRPYYIYGNSRGQGKEWVPMTAYDRVYEEICSWEETHETYFDYIFLASSTNATQSGLLAGSLQKGDNRRIVGISVSRNAERGREVIAGNLKEYGEKYGISLPKDYREHILFTDEYMEGGYGAWSPAVADMICKIYGNEGIPLDMTYTGKAFYGMVKYLEQNKIKNKKILFVHTGGTPLFFDFLEQEERH